MTRPTAPADAKKTSWVHSAPSGLQPYLRLSRFDRPAGFWLLGLPCWLGLIFARLDGTFVLDDLRLAVLFAIGAIAMRGAGCTYNDILDKDFDAKVERTALRPIPAGDVSIKAAWIWIAIQCGIGLLILLQLPRFAQYIALGSIPLVALYPLMKRITWWPQAWLGLTFNWGFLVAMAAIRPSFSVPDAILYAGLIAWTIGYDTIYAAQDQEDDALIGVKSTARRFGDGIFTALYIIYAITALAVATGSYLAAGPLAAVFTLPFSAHLMMQAYKFKRSNTASALKLFISNRDAAIILGMGWAFVVLFA